jgi:hypothetical protein
MIHKKCPCCKTKITKNNQIIVERTYQTNIVEFLDEEENTSTIASGYNNLEEWIDGMLCRVNKKPHILGCENCR